MDNNLIDSVLFAKINPSAIIPVRDDENGCYDIYACFEEEELIIKPHEIKLIPTGLKSAFSPKRRIGIRERGSTGSIGLSTRAGQIDSGFRGEWFICIQNTRDIPIIIKKGINKTIKHNSPQCPHIEYPYTKAIAQFAVEIVPDTIIVERTIEDIDSILSNRKSGMLGSSGK